MRGKEQKLNKEKEKKRGEGKKRTKIERDEDNPREEKIWNSVSQPGSVENMSEFQIKPLLVKTELEETINLSFFYK